MQEQLIWQAIGDRYLVTDRIAAGGMGIVCRAVDEQLHRPIAVKFLTPDVLVAGVAPLIYEGAFRYTGPAAT